MKKAEIWEKIYKEKNLARVSFSSYYRGRKEMELVAEALMAM
ncbi:hypothetical protein [Eubacterium ramulus]